MIEKQIIKEMQTSPLVVNTTARFYDHLINQLFIF
jgi:hypothetical protein